MYIPQQTQPPPTTKNPIYFHSNFISQPPPEGRFISSAGLLMVPDAFGYAKTLLGTPAHEVASRGSRHLIRNSPGVPMASGGRWLTGEHGSLSWPLLCSSKRGYSGHVEALTIFFWRFRGRTVFTNHGNDRWDGYWEVLTETWDLLIGNGVRRYAAGVFGGWSLLLDDCCGSISISCFKDFRS